MKKDQALIPIGEITLDSQKSIIESYISANNDSDVEKLLSQNNISKRTLNSIIRSNSALMQEIFASKCSLDVYKENKYISEIKEKSFTYLLEQVQLAQKSENPLIYLDKITRMIETIDKIDRLNRGESTENVKTTNTSTNTTVNISELMSQLSTPEEKKAFMLKKMESIKFNSK